MGPNEEQQLATTSKRRILILLAGIILGQFLLYGQSLLGFKILLPLDILSGPGVYIPRGTEGLPAEIRNVYLTDLVYVVEPVRQFLGSELREGRLPLWMPTQYCGTPAAYTFFSPLILLQALVKFPVVFAWSCLLVAIVAGTGCYRFLRDSVSVDYWPAAVCGWCYPMTGFFLFWQNYPTSYPVALLPWLLWATDRALRGTSSLAPAGLAVLTALVLTIGNLDIAGQVLLASGLFALWGAWQIWREGARGMLWRRLLAITVAWVLGFAVAAPHLLPLLEYSQAGSRIERRVAGEEERPPAGLAALPQVVLPDIYGGYGQMQAGTLRLVPGNQQESSASAYAGLFATLFLAPLAWSERKYRPMLLFCLVAAVLSLGWSLNIPGIVQLLRAPGMNLMSHNRFVFLASFALLCMAGMGLHSLARGEVRWQNSMWLPVAVLATLSGFCLVRAFSLPEPIVSLMERLARGQQPIGLVRDAAGVERVQEWFIRMYLSGAIICGLALGLWLMLRAVPTGGRGWLPLMAVLLPLDLLWFGFGRSPQSDPALYYPQVPALSALSQAPGRVIGFQCLPAQLCGMAGLRDVRGYDAVDPRQYVELLQLAAAPGSPALSYALTQWLVPRAEVLESGEVRLHPVLDLLGVHQAIYRGSPPAKVHPVSASPDYYVLINSRALPRVFVPKRVVVVADPQERLGALGRSDFDPTEVAYAEEPVALSGESDGSAEIVLDRPNRVEVLAQMKTPGLLLLADRWDPGWQSTVNGRPAAVLRVDHALRGVLLPEGANSVVFRYRPVSLLRGAKIAGLGGVTLLLWAAVSYRLRSRVQPATLPQN